MRYPSSSAARPAILGFTVFGAFWGAWGASIPALRDQAGLSDADLGTALLAIGAGAIPAMIIAGRTYDRWGGWVSFVAMVVLAALGVLTAWLATGLTSLIVLLALVGAASGAADVGINALAGAAQHRTGLPVVLRAHGMFSVAVVVSSLTTGAALEVGLVPAVGFAVVLALATAVGGLAIGSHRSVLVSAGGRTTSGGPSRVSGGWRALPQRQTLVLLGELGALAFAIENAHQSWGAVFLTDELDAGPLVAAIGPAAFAGTTALVRLGAAALPGIAPVTQLVLGALVAATGTLILATAPVAPVGLAGLVLAAVGTATLFPVLIGLLTGVVSDALRGTATSLVAGIAYVGYVAGPVYVGGWAGLAGLRWALVAVAGLGFVLAVLAAIRLPAGVRQGEHATVEEA